MKEGSEKQDKNIKKILLKRAMGYDVKETVEEYVSSEEGEIKLTKKKVTTKNVPPDLTAIKMLIGEEIPIEQMTDEQLSAEKKRLLKLLEDEK